MNVALDEANALQKRIDELQKRNQALTPTPVKERKDLNELQVEFERIRQQLSKLSQKVEQGEHEASIEVQVKREELLQQIRVLTATRDVCLQKAGTSTNVDKRYIVDPMWISKSSI